YVARQRDDFFLKGRCPYPDRPVPAAGRDAPVVRAKREAGDRSRVPAQGEEFPPAGGFHHPEAVRRAEVRQEPAIPTPGVRYGLLLGVLQGDRFLLGFQAEESQSPVPECHVQTFVLVSEGQVSDELLAAAQLRKFVAGGCLPTPPRLVQARRGNEPAVRAKRNGRYRLAVPREGHQLLARRRVADRDLRGAGAG